MVSTDGEIFWVPFHDKTAGPSYSILFEARIGRSMDRFTGVKDGEEMIRVARQVVAEVAPWELPHFAHVELTDCVSKGPAHAVERAHDLLDLGKLEERHLAAYPHRGTRSAHGFGE